jgi:hypothetical protein
MAFEDNPTQRLFCSSFHFTSNIAIGTHCVTCRVLIKVGRIQETVTRCAAKANHVKALAFHSKRLCSLGCFATNTTLWIRGSLTRLFLMMLMLVLLLLLLFLGRLRLRLRLVIIGPIQHSNLRRVQTNNLHLNHEIKNMKTTSFCVTFAGSLGPYPTSPQTTGSSAYTERKNLPRSLGSKVQGIRM